MIELLLALILAVTGIGRAVDPELTAIAERRAVETSVVFSHDGQELGIAEVLAWNQGYPDPATQAVDQWRRSAPHWAILVDPVYTRIGCGHHAADGRDYFVCVLAGEPIAAARTPNPQPVGAAPTAGATSQTEQPAPMLPNTAMMAP